MTKYDPNKYNKTTMFYQLDSETYEVSLEGSYTRDSAKYEPDAVISLGQFKEDGSFNAGLTITSNSYDRIPTYELKRIVAFMEKLEVSVNKNMPKMNRQIAKEVGAKTV